MSWTCVAYMDETHNADSYWICGVVVSVDKVVEVQAALVGVAERAAVSFGLDEPPELHGYEIWQREGAFEGVAPRACAFVYGWALDALVAAER